jgi:hypothetical protein
LARLPFVDTHVHFFWPVDRLYSSYGDVLDACSELISDLTEPEQRALFSENAQRIFRLDLPAAT